MSERIYYSQEAEQQARRNKLVLVMMVAGLSVGIGAMISLLFAPQRGDKTREQLGEQVNNTVSKGREVAKTASKQILDNGEKALNNLNDRVQAIKE